MSELNTAPATPEPTDAELQNFDPVFDVPSPVTVTGSNGSEADTASFLHRISTPTLEALPPEKRAEVEAKIAADPGDREAATERHLNAALYEIARDVRMKAGPGPGATETQRAMSSVANQVRLLGAEANAIQARLDEVADYTSELDPATGEPRSVPVMTVRGDGRSAMRAELADRHRRIGLLLGHEGDRMLSDAAVADKAQIKARREELEDLQEAQRRAGAMVRENKIAKTAEAFARNRASSLG